MENVLASLQFYSTRLSATAILTIENPIKKQTAKLLFSNVIFR